MDAIRQLLGIDMSDSANQYKGEQGKRVQEYFKTKVS